MVTTRGVLLVARDVVCALLIAAALMAGTAHAQTLASNGVQVSARQSGNTVPQTPSNNVMSVLVPITIGVAAVGAAAVAIPATGAIAIAGDAIASAGMAAIRSGAIQGVALAAVIGMIPGDKGVALDANGNVVAPAVSANSGDSGFNGQSWYCSGGGRGASPLAACLAAFALVSSKYQYASGGVSCKANGDGTFGCATGGTPYDWSGSANPTGVCISGYVSSGGSCVPDPNGAKQAATDAQIKSAISAAPASWPSIYNDMNCGPSLALTDGSTSDPCFALYADSRSGFGVSFSTGGSSWTNNGCAVNSTSCPSATVTTAPATDTQTKVNADGSKTTTTNTSTKTTTVTGTNDRTNPVESQTTTTTSTSTTVTNPDGSTTTTTTTTTDQAPPAAASNPANDQQQTTTASLASPDIKLYTKKTRTFADVLNAFASTVKGSAIGAGISGFFTISASGGCPQWVIPATDYTPSFALGPIFCSSSAMSVYAIAGIAVLIGCAWAAFAIAFL